MKKLRFLTVIVCVIMMALVMFSCRQEDDTTPVKQITQKEKHIAAFNEVFCVLQNDLSEDVGSISGLIWDNEESFSITDFKDEKTGELENSSVIFEDGTFYFDVDSLDLDGNIVPSNSIIRLYDAGMITLVPQESGMAVTTESFASVFGEQSVWNTLMIGEEDLIDTDTKDKYEISSEYLDDVLVVLSGSDAIIDSGVYFSATVDFGKLETDGEISVELTHGLSLAKTNIKFTKKETEDGAVDYRIYLLANEKEIGRISVHLSEDDIKLDLDMESDGSKIEFSIEAKLVDGDPNKQSLYVRSTVESGGSVFGLMINFVLQTNGEDLVGLEGSFGLSYANLNIYGNISFDSSALSKVGGEVLAADIEVLVDTDITNLSASVITVSSSSDSSEYKMILTVGADEDEMIVSAKLNSPSLIKPNVSDEAQKYLSRADKYFLNASAVDAKIEELHQRVRESAKGGNVFRLVDKCYTLDPETGLAYFTVIEKNGTTLNNITTECIIDYENYTYFYSENTGDFINVRPCGSDIDAQNLSALVYSNIPEGYYLRNKNAFWVYEYIDEVGIYLAIRGDDVTTVRYFTDEPKDILISKEPTHNIRFGDGGAAIIHDFEMSYDEFCHRIYKCRECEFWIEGITAEHNEMTLSKTENGSIDWELSYCDRCEEGAMTVYDESSCTFTVKIAKFDKSHLYPGVFERYFASDSHPLEKMLVVKDIVHIPADGCTYHESFEIPSLDETTEYKFVGVVKNEAGGTVYDHSCNDVDRLVLPEGLIYIGEYGLRRGGYKEILIPDSCVYFCESAFASCRNLAEIEIPDGTTTIESSMFQFCVSLAEITIPDGVTAIRYDAFYGCSALSSVIIPDSVTLISMSAFYGCTGLVSVTIPDSVTKIDAGAFGNCTSLTKVVIPESVEIIGERAFQNCSNLSDISIGCEEINIGLYAFSGCKDIVSIQFNGTVDSWKKIPMNGKPKKYIVYCIDGNFEEN